jgi:hypothetical protein
VRTFSDRCSKYSIISNNTSTCDIDTFRNSIANNYVVVYNAETMVYHQSAIDHFAKSVHAVLGDPLISPKWNLDNLWHKQFEL